MVESEILTDLTNAENEIVKLKEEISGFEERLGIDTVLLDAREKTIKDLNIQIETYSNLVNVPSRLDKINDTIKEGFANVVESINKPEWSKKQ